MSNFSGAVEAGRAYVAFGANTTKFTQGMKKMHGQIRHLGAAMQATGMQLFAGGLVAAAPLAAAFKAFAELEGNLTFLAGIVGKTRKEMIGLENTIMDLGATTVFTLEQVSEAAIALGRAGFTESQIIVSLDSVLALAQATRIELAEAAEITTDAIRAFGLSIGDAGKVVDILTKTSNSSSQSMTDLKESLSFVAAQANVTGISIEDTSLFLGILANNGQKASIAGTGLQRALINLQSAAKQKALAKLGIDIRGLDGNLKPLPQLFREMEGQLANLDNTARNAVFNDIFGRGARAANILSRSFQDGSDVTGEFATEAEKLADGINNAKSAMEIQAEIADSAFGKMKKLVSAFEALKNAIGEGVALAGMAEAFTKFFGGVKNLVTINPQVIAAFTKSTALVVGIGAALIALGAIFSSIAAIIAPVVAIVGVLGAKFVAIGALIAYVTFTILAMFDAIGPLVDTMKAWFSELGRGFTLVKDLFSGGDLDLAWEALMTTLSHGWKRMIAVAKEAWAGLMNFMFDNRFTKELDEWFGTSLNGKSSWTDAGEHQKTLYNMQLQGIEQKKLLRDQERAAKAAADKAESEKKAAEELDKQKAVEQRNGGDLTGLEGDAEAAAKKEADAQKKAVDDLARLKQKADELELARLKNKLEIDKRRTQEAQRLRTVAAGPSSADIRSAAGFNPLLASQNGMVAAIKGVEIAVREAALKDTELQVERRGISLSIARNTAAIGDTQSKINP